MLLASTFVKMAFTPVIEMWSWIWTYDVICMNCIIWTPTDLEHIHRSGGLRS